MKEEVKDKRPLEKKLTKAADIKNMEVEAEQVESNPGIFLPMALVQELQRLAETTNNSAAYGVVDYRVAFKVVYDILNKGIKQ